MLLAVGAAQAGPMTLADTVTDTANSASDPTPTSWFLPPAIPPGYTPPWYRYANQDWGWNHAVSYLPDPSPCGSGVFSFVSGSLTVHAWGVNDDDPTLIYGDGVLLGSLLPQPPGFGNDWTTTTFLLSPAFLQSHLADGLLNVWMDIDSTLVGSGVILDWGHLIVDYQWDWECPAIPAPATIGLAGVGAGLVGWFKRRRYI
ncbi:MAG: hypothetical protein A2Y76_11715 [Planctomycetes bacterium RBG_13_60_9]|nr:MAG: hypothetical protein A2Y76_11715 [Planctomycetes bacterium RBG_13_60_9]